jgi:hypothetical protein
MKKLLFLLMMFVAIPYRFTLAQYEIIEIEAGIDLGDINNNLEGVGKQGNAPILWRNGIIKTLDLPPSASDFNVRSINDNGIIVGNVRITGMTQSVMAKWDTSGTLLYYANNTYRSSAGDINNSNNAAGFVDECENCPTRAVIFLPNNNFSIIPSFTANAQAIGINESNWVAGIRDQVDSTGQEPFIWKGTGNITILSEPQGASVTYADDLNENGYVIGKYWDGAGLSKPVYWINEQLFLPPMPPGNFIGGDLSDINSRNQIVGRLFAPNYDDKGIIIENGEIKLLNDLIPADSDWNIKQGFRLNDNGAILAYGSKDGVSRFCILMPFSITNPVANDKWIASETDTIKWIGASWLAVNIKCIINYETPIESEIILATGYPIIDPEFEWEIPEGLLSYRSKLIIENANNTDEKIEGGIFRIKPYVLTRLNADSTYSEYRKNRDQWGFSNTQPHMWPASWYIQFNYRGIDPFTNNLQYSQSQGDSVFAKMPSFAHMDWISWVNSFGVDACYFSAFNGMYKPTALIKWWSKLGVWKGSCFGIAAANALAFSHKEQFQNKYPNYPDFINPITVASDTGVKRVVNELYTHQYGNPTQANDPAALAKTPNQTLNEIRQMLLEDTAQIKTLSIYNNGGDGGHTILAYGLKQNPVQKNLFYVQIYDNSNPNSNNPITIDTLANGGTGSWSTPDWAGWGGNQKIHLEIPSIQYLNGATFPARSIPQSAFILPQNVLEINYQADSEIKIVDTQGNITGYVNNLVLNQIPGSLPQTTKNGSETPPYGYSLPTDNYSVVLSEFAEDTVSTFFFTGNKSFMYERNGATQTQTDRLFFDGGVSAVNPDGQIKTIKLLNLINETTQEKLTVVRSLKLIQNDSVKIENPDSNKVKLISYGSAKDYDIELNYVTESGIGRFGDFGIPLTANTSHTFVPDWTDLTNTQLTVLVDIGNDGTIDDTLYLNNTVDVEDRGSLLSPNNYNLAQNYPNPFNPITTIQYSIPQRSSVTLKVYDVLGNEIAALVNEEKERGVYLVNFDASNLASGIYLYRIQAGSFVETKKMILLR